MLIELGEQVFEKHLATQIFPESRALVRAHRQRGHCLRRDHDSGLQRQVPRVDDQRLAQRPG